MSMINGFLCLVCLSLLCSSNAYAASYHVGPNSGQLSSISQVPWATLNAGDTVNIHWRTSAYKEKWVIGRSGTNAAPITIRGIPNSSGDLPVIDGNAAVTVSGVNYWNEERSVIKIGGSNIPANSIPKHIIVENLAIRSARPAYSFINDNGNPSTYSSNAASIHIERGQHITIRNCILHDSGNGLFCGKDAGNTQDILIEKCHLYNNGISGSYLEHNSYTSAIGITFQYNHYGPLRAGCDGNNLKDRSAGTVIRYNWIESGNRQLDLVDEASFNHLSAYNTTHVYANILVEPNSGNRQIIHYGGDSGNSNNYRKGTLHLYNNTIISTRSGRSTLIRLSSSGETCDAVNNIVYVTDSGNQLELLSNNGGTLNMHHNWIKTGYVLHHGAANGSVVNNLGNIISGSSPGFNDFAAQDFSLAASSPCIDAGSTLSISINKEYSKHQNERNRPVANALDFGAFERPADNIRRLVSILLPNNHVADINPHQNADISGNTYTFNDLNPSSIHSLSITATVNN